MASRMELAVGSRASARVQPACARKCRTRPMLAGSEATSAASPWVEVLCIVGTHPFSVSSGLGWPCGGGARPQQRVIGESIIAVIYSDP